MVSLTKDERYNRSDKGRARSVTYNRSEKGRARYERYRVSAKGQVNQRKKDLVRRTRERAGRIAEIESIFRRDAERYRQCRA